MYSFFNYVVWAPDPVIFSVSFLKIRWYGLLFAVGFVLALQIMYIIFKKEGKPMRDVDSLAIYMIIAAIIGARLGHVFFYEPQLYLSDPIKILKIWEGGLAGFGAAIGIIIAVMIYKNYYIRISVRAFKIKKIKREGQPYLWIVDRLVIGTAIIACLIRVGNLINSEFAGKPTSNAWGFVFAWEDREQLMRDHLISSANVFKPENNTLQVEIDQSVAPVIFEIEFVSGENEFKEENVRSYIEDNIKKNLSFQPAEKHLRIAAGEPLDYQLHNENNKYSATIEVLGIKRHPVQLYEAISSFIIFLVLMVLWYRKQDEVMEGLLFGLFLVSFFGLHFLYQFLIEVIPYRKTELPLTLEQWMSMPMILTGLFLLIYIFRKSKRHHFSTNDA